MGNTITLMLYIPVNFIKMYIFHIETTTTNIEIQSRPSKTSRSFSKLFLSFSNKIFKWDDCFKHSMLKRLLLMNFCLFEICFINMILYLDLKSLIYNEFENLTTYFLRRDEKVQWNRVWVSQSEFQCIVEINKTKS